MDLSLFKNDKNLVHGEVNIADSLTVPALWGTYSIRLPDDQLTQEKLASIKVILWSCMDRRVVRPLYDQLVQQGYKPEEILAVSMGGGPIQSGNDRIDALRNALTQLVQKVPQVEKIWAVAHTGVCGGLKHFCGGQPITEVAKPEYVQQAVEQGIDPEVYLTDLILGNAIDMIPEVWQGRVKFAIAEPDEATQTVKIHPHQITPAETKPLAALIR